VTQSHCEHGVRWRGAYPGRLNDIFEVERRCHAHRYIHVSILYYLQDEQCHLPCLHLAVKHDVILRARYASPLFTRKCACVPLATSWTHLESIYGVVGKLLKFLQSRFCFCYIILQRTALVTTDVGCDAKYEANGKCVPLTLNSRSLSSTLSSSPWRPP
jgi:hypothetical protein